MRSRCIKVFLFTLAFSLLALSCCAFAYAAPGLGTVRISVPAPGTDTIRGCSGFDVQGTVDDKAVSTTDGNAGFRTYLKLGSDTPILLATYKSLYFEESYGTEEVTVSLSAATGFSGRAAIIYYTVTNNTDDEMTVRIGSCGDTQVGNDTGANVAMVNGGFVSESGGLSLLVFPGAESFSNAWCGPVGQADDSVFIRSENDSSQWPDNAMAWSWVVPLQPGQTATRSVVIAVVYSSNPITVYFHPNGGQGGVQRRTAIKDCEYDLPPNTFVRGGYRFVGWAESEDALEADYEGDDTIPADRLYDGMTLYAVWEDKAAQKIEARDVSLSFGDTDVRVEATSTDGRLSYEVKEGSDVIAIDRSSGLISAKKVGQATVTVRAAATNDSHEATKDVTVTVLQKQLDRTMLTLTPDSFGYTGQYQNPTISVKNGERPMVRGTDYEIDASSELKGRELGEYRITINGLGNYSGSTSAVWKISKEAPAAELSAYSAVYDGSAHPLVAVTKHTGGTLQFSLQQGGPYSEEIPEAADAGTYTVWYRIAGDERWLDIGPFSRTAVISKKPVAVSGITAADKVYDGSSSAELVYNEAVIDGICSGDELSVRSASGMFADADVGQDKPVRISAITLGGADAGNYDLTALQQQSGTNAAITPRPVTVRAKDQTVPLASSILTGLDQVTLEGDGLSLYDELYSVALSGTTLNATTKGKLMPDSAVIVRHGTTQHMNGNYTITYEPGKLTVEPMELKLSWSDTEFVYDGKSHKPTATVSGMLGNEKLSVIVTGAKIAATPEGEEYTATAASLSGLKASNYKLPAEATQTFKITPRSLEADEISVEYRPDDDPTVIGPVPADGKAYGFRSITVYDGTRRLIKNVDYKLENEYSTTYGPHTLRIVGKGNYKDSLSREWTLIGNGGLTASVDVKNGGAAVYWNNASETLASSLLDAEDFEVREEYGAPADVSLQIKPLSGTFSSITAKASQLGETIGANYDLSLIKKIGNGATIIHDTEGIPIEVTIDIPDELRKAPLGYYRSFTLIHLNKGSAEVVASGTGSSFTFTTTSFSAYAISYHDIPLPPNSSPPTGDTARLPLWSTALLLSAGALLWLARRRRKA